MRSASTETSPARITAGSGSTSHEETAPTLGSGIPPMSSRNSSSGRSGWVQSALARAVRTVARRDAAPSRNGPHQTPASTRSPPTLIHSVCVPAGSAPWSMPGATFAPVAGTRRASDVTHDQGGDHDSGASMRLPPLRRAGSTKQPRPASGTGSFHGPGVVRTSPLDVVTSRPRSAAVADSAHRTSGSRSTASTCRPAAAIARASLPAPHPRSATTWTPACTNRRACRAATSGRVACSRPSGVHQRAGPGNRAVARVRSRAWVAAAATTCAWSAQRGSQRARLSMAMAVAWS